MGHIGVMFLLFLILALSVCSFVFTSAPSSISSRKEVFRKFDLDRPVAVPMLEVWDSWFRDMASMQASLSSLLLLPQNSWPGSQSHIDILS